MKVDNQSENKLILRDILAADRTTLANERTLLSYLRTALSFSLAGLTIIKLFPSLWSYILGSIGIILGVIFTYLGFYRYLNTRKDLKKIKQKDL